MMEDEIATSARDRNAITPGEDLDHLSLEDLSERRALLEAEIARIDAITDKKRAGRDAADAVFKF